MRKRNKRNINLIRCGDDGWSPWCILCVHLMGGTSKIWVPIPVHDRGEIENDWLCPVCAANLEAHNLNGERLNMNNLKAVCMHCVRKIRRRAGLEV